MVSHLTDIKTKTLTMIWYCSHTGQKALLQNILHIFTQVTPTYFKFLLKWNLTEKPSLMAYRRHHPCTHIPHSLQSSYLPVFLLSLTYQTPKVRLCNCRPSPLECNHESKDFLYFVHYCTLSRTCLACSRYSLNICCINSMAWILGLERIVVIWPTSLTVP